MKSFIFGDRVSEFARSPKIWNALYKEFQLDNSMTPLDATVGTIEDVILEVSRTENKFCGLIAAPLKDHEIWFSLNGKSKAEVAKSVNYVEYENGSIRHLDNFDGKAALSIISSHVHDARRTIKRVSIIGTGPVARIIEKELEAFLGGDCEINFFTRKLLHEKPTALSPNLHRVYHVSSLDAFLPITDLVINCSPIGSPRFPGTPLSESQFIKFGPKTAYFDVNYGQETPQGVRTYLQMGGNSFDGLEMNKLQAAMAFTFANSLSCDFSSLVMKISDIP